MFSELINKSFSFGFIALTSAIQTCLHSAVQDDRLVLQRAICRSAQHLEKAFQLLRIGLLLLTARRLCTLSTSLLHLSQLGRFQFDTLVVQLWSHEI